MNAKWISIFLPDGNPNGVKMVEIKNRNIRGFFIPRAQLKDVYGSEEFKGLKNPSLYFLVVRGGEDIYIGEAENFLDRVHRHNIEKSFWDTAIVFTGDLDKADVKLLESIAIAEARTAERFKLKNANASSTPNLHRFKIAALQEYCDDMKLLVASLGYPVFDKIEIASVAEESVWYCTARRTRAVAVDDGASFTVLKDSQIDATERPSFHRRYPASAEKRRELLRRYGKEKEGVYRLKQNIPFTSANQAGSFCVGGHTNAWTTWKNKAGDTMDQRLRKSVDS